VSSSRELDLCDLFGEFLRNNFCKENLLYWIVVVDSRKKSVVTSLAVASDAPLPADWRSARKIQGSKRRFFGI
jgi:hypothetical protein